MGRAEVAPLAGIKGPRLPKMARDRIYMRLDAGTKARVLYRQGYCSMLLGQPVSLAAVMEAALIKGLDAFDREDAGK